MRLYKNKKFISAPMFSAALFAMFFLFFLVAIAIVSDEVDENEISALQGA